MAEQGFSGLDYQRCAIDLRDAIVHGNTVAVDDLSRAIEPYIWRIAADVAKGNSRQELEEFCEEAISAIIVPRAKSGPRLASYDDSKGDFGAWVKTCLSRIWISRKRKQKRERRVQGVTTLNDQDLMGGLGKADEIPWYFQETVEIMKYPFTFCDMRSIDTWSVRERLELLSLSGLFVRVPLRVWERFIVDYEDLMHVRLARPFPLLTVTDCDDRFALTHKLCDAINAMRTTMDKRWSRGQKKLLTIPSMRRVFRQWVGHEDE